MDTRNKIILAVCGTLAGICIMMCILRAVFMERLIAIVGDAENTTALFSLGANSNNEMILYFFTIVFILATAGLTVYIKERR